MRFLEHTTTEGERWDAIAERYYGDSYAYVQIIEANPAVAIVPMLPAGIRLLIPIVEAPTSRATDLPPWKVGV